GEYAKRSIHLRNRNETHTLLRPSPGSRKGNHASSRAVANTRSIWLISLPASTRTSFP
ncbi:unnamed protein product, partial [Musa textilis]